MQLGFDGVQVSSCRGVNGIKIINDPNLIIIESSAEAGPYMVEH